MKKVLHILNSLLASGAETMLSSSGDYWDKNLERHIVATSENLGEYADQLTKSGYIIHHIYNPKYVMQHRAIIKFIKENKFDIVHIHRQSQACSYAFDARVAGAKHIVRTVHNVFMFHGLVQIREFITRQIACFLGVKHIAISPSVSDNEKKRFCIPTITIRNWYNDNRFYYTTQDLRKVARVELGIDDNTYCIVSVGNCTPVKNHMSILRALLDMKNRGQKQKVIYLHVGKGMQEEEEKTFVQKNGLNECVRFVGFDDPVKYLQAADLFVMPSVYEGFGISGIEGIATGVKTLFTEVPGLIDFKSLGFENLYYSKLDDSEISEKIAQIIDEGMKENSRNQAIKVKELYGIAGGVELYQKVYNS